MKANAPKRKIFSDAVDLLTDSVIMKGEHDVKMLPIDSITSFRNHPFHLYEGDRLKDMVESIRENGILVPVIVLKNTEGYEMLAGHNRQNAARIAGLSEIPAIVKEGLSEKEAYVYVIETNVIQRSFADLLPSEKAAVIQAHYDKMCCQGKRNDIIQELQILNGAKTDLTCGQNGHKLKMKNRDLIAAEYGFSSRSAARYLRLNYLIKPFKEKIDAGTLAMGTGVDLSFLKEQEQQMVWEIMEKQRLALKPKMAVELRKYSGELTEERVRKILDVLSVRKHNGNVGMNVKVSKGFYDKYFIGMDPEQMASIVELALTAWFEKQEI